LILRFGLINVAKLYKDVFHYVVTRFMLKDLLPLTEDDFVMGNTPANLRVGLDMGDGRNIQDWAIPLSPRPVLCHQDLDLDSGSTIEKAIMDHSPLPASVFQFDYVEVEPINYECY
jgi:hypothetical protein